MIGQEPVALGHLLELLRSEQVDLPEAADTFPQPAQSVAQLARRRLDALQPILVLLQALGVGLREGVADGLVFRLHFGELHPNPLQRLLRLPQPRRALLRGLVDPVHLAAMRGELRRGAAQLLLQPIVLPVQERLLPLAIGGAGSQRADRLRGLVFLRGQIRADLALLVELPLRGGELRAQRGSLLLRPRRGHLALLHGVAQLALPFRALAIGPPQLLALLAELGDRPEGLSHVAVDRPLVGDDPFRRDQLVEQRSGGLAIAREPLHQLLGRLHQVTEPPRTLFGVHPRCRDGEPAEVMAEPGKRLGNIVAERRRRGGLHPLAQPLIELGDDLVGDLAKLVAQAFQALFVRCSLRGRIGDAPLRFGDPRAHRRGIPTVGSSLRLRVRGIPFRFGQPGAGGFDLGFQGADALRERLVAAVVRVHARFQLIDALAAEPYFAPGPAHGGGDLVQAFLGRSALFLQALDRGPMIARAGRGCVDLVLDVVPLLRLPRQALLDTLAAIPQSAQAQQFQVALDLERLRAQGAVALGSLRLHAQGLVTALHLAPDVLHLRHVGGRLLQLALGFDGAGAVGQDAGRLLEDLAALLGLLREDPVDPSLLQRCVAGGGKTGIGKHLAHVAQPALRVVDEVLALAGAIQAALDADLRGVDRQPPVLVGEHQRDLGHAQRAPAAGAIEDHVLHALGAQRAGRLLAQRPADGVNDVALAAAVRSDQRGHVAAELQYRAVGKGLEAEEFDPLQ